MSDTNTIPTGKYKGKSPSDAVQDEKYIQWVTVQPWYVAAVMIHKELQNAKNLSTVATVCPQ